MYPKAIAAVLAAGLIGIPAYADVNNRQSHQVRRIAQGWQTGALTGAELLLLGRQQARIARTEHRMRADGGGLGAAERVRLHHMQDHASGRIFITKHNQPDR